MNDHFMQSNLSNRRTIRTAKEIEMYGLISSERVEDINVVSDRYAIAITQTLIDLIDSSDPFDPIALQFIPDIRELVVTPNEHIDPIGDIPHMPIKGIVHRYHDRCLLIPTMNCPVYCRFCFRRERVGNKEKIIKRDDMIAAISYIREHNEIWEVIITGGDPLILSPSYLSMLVRELDNIPHVQIIRFHTRVPISDPYRITSEMIDVFNVKTTTWIVIHCNHARELGKSAMDACRRLNLANIPLLGQTVLLKGVNDDPIVMEALMRALVVNHIKPYYIHHLDLAPGTNHFRITIAKGQEIIKYLHSHVSGICQPNYVLDIPGGYGKSSIDPVYFDGNEVMDWKGKKHHYPLNI
ncbi:MAG: lysine-2,3-aminomutase-like protein [Rhodospirillaceae bacterium]|jgi:lysine 2,3-aminomutase|nr:lysine-2,3-aminomutase-like protein [Rhodospirillaceae bacterium]